MSTNCGVAEINPHLSWGSPACQTPPGLQGAQWSAGLCDGGPGFGRNFLCCVPTGQQVLGRALRVGVGSAVVTSEIFEEGRW